MDTKRKVEFGVQQIIYKVGELVKMSGGKMDEQLKDQFQDITRTILSNQTEALGNLTKKAFLITYVQYACDYTLINLRLKKRLAKFGGKWASCMAKCPIRSKF